MPTYEASDLKVNIDFECHAKDDKVGPMVKYQATVLFSSLAKLLESGGESVKRKLQNPARDGKFPVGRRVLVDENGKYSQTPEEKAKAVYEHIAALEDEAELEKLFELYQAKKAAKLAAANAAATE